MDTSKSVDLKTEEYLTLLSNKQEEAVLAVVRCFAEKQNDW